MIKIISSNIRFQNIGDGVNNWPNRRHILADAINDFAPDILGTQEGWQPQLRDFHSLLPNMDIIDSHRSWIEDRMYPTLFLKKGVFEVLQSGDIWLSETPYIAASKSFNSAFPRLCTWTHICHKVTSQRMLVINAHLDHLETQTRQRQIEVLINETVKVSRDPMILIGDFNEGPMHKVRSILDSKLCLNDAWQILKKEEETSHHSFKGFREDGERIDWILTSTNFEAQDIYLYKDKSEGIYPSDHYPVFAKFKSF